MKDIIFVKGNIIFKSGNHQVKELVGFATEYYEHIAEEIINGDLIITKNDILNPYKIYCASKDIVSYGIGIISALQRPENVLKIYENEINQLQKLRNQKIENNLTKVLNRQIYIGVVGTMELFLGDFLYVMVLGTRKYFKKFYENSNQTYTLKQITNSNWNKQNAVKEIILSTNYHKIGIVKSIYKKILGIEFPPTNNLEKLIKTRHNLVHRNGYPSKDSSYAEIDDNVLDDLINEVNLLIQSIIEIKKEEIKRWLPDILQTNN